MTRVINMFITTVRLSFSHSVDFLFLSAWYSEPLEDGVDDNFDVVFPERLDKERMKRDLTTGIQVLTLKSKYKF